MLRANLVGITETVPAAVQASQTVLRATMRPAYAKAAAIDYRDATGKPSINGIVLEGDMTLADLGILEAGESDIDALFRE